MDRCLADVLVQLIAQWLPSADKLRLARCSRSLLHAIDSAFAWRDAVVPLRFSMQSHSASIPARSLVRHSSICVRVDFPRHMHLDELLALAELMRSCRLVAVDLSHASQVTVQQWTLLCAVFRQQPLLTSLSRLSGSCVVE